MKTKPLLLYLALQWLLVLSASAATPKYDLDGRVIGVTYSDGSTIDYPRDSNGNQRNRIVTRPVELTLTVDPPDSGTVTGAGRYLRNTQQSLTATAGSDFTFAAWKRADGTILATTPNYIHTISDAETLTAHFRALSPEIVIEDTTSDPAANLADGTSTLVFAHPTPLTRTLTVRNVGTAPLTGLSATLDGPGASLFSKAGLPTNLAARGSVTFTVQFTPLTPVVSTAALHVLSNDADEGSFDLTLNGTMACPAVNVTPPATSQGGIGTAINRVFTQSGGLGTVTFALVSGSLPSGVTLSSAGTLAGIPSQMGSFPMTVSVSDSYGCTGTSGTYTLLISNGGPDGSLDTSFGTDGKTTTHFGSGDDIAFGVVLQPDGKAVAAGFAFHEGKKRFALARYNVDGTLDATFNSTGKVITSVSSGEDEAHCLAFQPDGKIIAAGYTRPATAEVALVRYHANGTLDTTFGSGGKVITPVAEGDDDARAILLQPDGKIVIVGYGYRSSGTNDVIVLRYNADGSLDHTFGTGGKLMFAFGGSYDNGFGAALQPDGKIIAVGSTFDGLDHWAIARITSNGTLDSSFDSDGKVTTSFATGSQSASSVAVQPDGKIVVGGEADIGGSYNFALARYNSSGSLDTTFGSGGKVTTDWYGRMDLGRALAIQRDGKILLAGMARNSADKFNMAVARYLRDGSLDTSFGTAGKTLVPVAATDDRANALAIMPFGAVTLAGQSFNGSDDDFAVVRVNSLVVTPDIEVEAPPGSSIALGDMVHLGSAPNGAGVTKVFTIKNSGNSDLLGLTAAIDGPDAQMFALSSSPSTSVASNSSTTLSVRFSPTMTGERTARLRITSNDPDEESFDANLKGTGTFLMPSFDEDLNFDDNQVPAGWTLGYPLGGPGRNASIANGRFDVRQVDTYGGLHKAKVVPTTAHRVVISYTGNMTANYWGQGTQTHFLTSEGYYFTSFGKSGYGAATMTATVGKEPTQPWPFQQQYPLDTGTYRMTTMLEDGRITYTIHKSDSATFLVNEVVQMPTLQIHDLQTLRLFALTTTGDPSWIDDVSIRAIPMSPSESWRQQYFGISSNSGDGADDATPMHDDIPNLMKFATGMDPTKSGRNPGLATRVGGTMTFTYIRNKAAEIDGLIFVVEWSDTLAGNSWSNIGVNETTVDQGVTEIVTATLPAGSSSKRFVRLRVSRP